MSDLQRSFAKAKLASYPALPPTTFDEADEEEESDTFNTELVVDDDSSSASSASSASSTGTIIPSSNQKLFARPQGYSNLKLALSHAILTLVESDHRTKEPWTKYHGRRILNASFSSSQRPTPQL